MNRNPDLVNPGWERPSDWPYEEDWGSPAWKRRMAETHAASMKLREEHGFLDCPKCRVFHTAKTLACRVCDYRVLLPSKEKP